MELDKYIDPDEIMHPDYAQIIQSLAEVLERDNAKSSYYNELLERPKNQAFADSLLTVLGESEDISWDLYALRSTNILFYPGSSRSTIVVGQTIFYSHEYERYSQPAKGVLQRSFELAGYDIVDETERGITINDLSRKDLLDGMIEVYSLVIFSGAPPLIQR